MASAYAIAFRSLAEVPWLLPGSTRCNILQRQSIWLQSQTRAHNLLDFMSTADGSAKGTPRRK